MIHLYKSYSDEQLILLLQNSDEGAFTELYNRYWEILFGISYNYCRQKETVEGVIQDIFMRLWDNRTALNISNVGAYLATSAKYSIFKQIVRQKRRQKLVAQHFTPQEAVDEEAMINSRFLQEYISGVVEKLPKRCRIVYKLRREKDLPVKEIASQLDISPKTVANHLTKALRFIGLALKNVNI